MVAETEIRNRSGRASALEPSWHWPQMPVTEIETARIFFAPFLAPGTQPH